MTNTRFSNCAANFAERLRQAMKARGVNQRELSVASGLSEAFISRLVHGERIPSLDALNRLATALWIDIGDLWRVNE